MAALLGAELQRLLARRLVRVLALLAAVSIVIAGVAVFATNENGEFELTNLVGIFKGTSGLLVILVSLVGASFAGADWQSEVMRTTLTWEPRRVRLMLAKALACSAVCALGVLVAQSLLGMALVPAATWRGTTAGADADWLGTLVATSLRITALAAVVAALSFALAMIGRRTSVVMAAGFLYLAVVESAIRSLFDHPEPWLFGDNAGVLVEGHSHVGIEGRSPLEAALFLSACAAVALVVAAAWFRARDVS